MTYKNKMRRRIFDQPAGPGNRQEAAMKRFENPTVVVAGSGGSVDPGCGRAFLARVAGETDFRKAAR